MKNDANNIERAVKILRAGGLVAFPTETVYGLGADAQKSDAVLRIFQVKKRPAFDPLIVHVASIEQAESLAHFTREAELLAERFWPGPLTLVLPRRSVIPDIVTSGLPHVGLRLPSHTLARQLLEASGLALAAPSANPFGYISPTRAEHVQASLGDSIELILDGGECQCGIESSIVSFHDGEVSLLRYGAVKGEELEEALGRSIPYQKQSSPDRPEAPGRLTKHYAPRTPLYFDPDQALLASLSSEEKASSGLLAFQEAELDFGCTEVLSSEGSLEAAAKRLFAAMRKLDQAGLKSIYAQRFPDQGLGRAINDRLKRASISA